MELTPSSVDVADALTQILPVDTAERLADHLTRTDVATLLDLVRASVPTNTLRAVASDLAYLEAWSVASTGFYLAWPPSDAAALSFIAHHLFRPGERAARGEGYGMPTDVEKELRGAGVLRGSLPHAPATVSRCHVDRNLETNEVLGRALPATARLLRIDSCPALFVFW